MSRPRKQHKPEFMMEVVLLPKKCGWSVKQLERELGIGTGNPSITLGIR